ncbi:helix-turn-helix domain-containing protein, partial [Microbispora siamensis]|uniref:helix-turn-helix domain-containing protein n=1 Tax=Microbispora siamensis TaxID=564413 RepID=UPI00194E6339
MRTAYKVRIYPTAEQAAVLNRTFGCVRLVWNLVLAWRQARYRAEGVTTSYAQTDRY